MDISGVKLDRGRYARSRATLVVALALALSAASGVAVTTTSCTSSAPPTALTRAQLLDPEQCRSCHASAFREWSGSMHAYASDDPVFVAMNARFLRESAGPRDLCVGCHAPVARSVGLSSDGANLATVPKWAHGVTCFACHTISSIEGDHNAALTFGKDVTLRGPIADPLGDAPHASMASAAFDGENAASSAPCGTCHDVRNGHGLDVERTYAEWRGSVYAFDDPKVRLTCPSCHMPGRVGTAADVAGAPSRRVHDHSMPGVDVALVPFPEATAQREGVQRSLDATLVAKLCVAPPQGDTSVAVTLDDAFAGHGFPSGALHDRRAWVELVARANGAEVASFGVVAEGAPVTTAGGTWVLTETLFDASKKPVPFLWDAFSAAIEQLPPAVTNVPTDPRWIHSVTKTFAVPPTTDEIAMRVRIIPIGLEVLDDLIASGDLAPALRAAMPVFDLASTKLRWTKAGGYGCVP
jgi:nitrate/TMAO reductase-like tetraheme cytochrome c subunit